MRCVTVLLAFVLFISQAYGSLTPIVEDFKVNISENVDVEPVEELKLAEEDSEFANETEHVEESVKEEEEEEEEPKLIEDEEEQEEEKDEEPELVEDEEEHEEEEEKDEEPELVEDE